MLRFLRRGKLRKNEGAGAGKASLGLALGGTLIGSVCCLLPALALAAGA